MSDDQFKILQSRLEERMCDRAILRRFGLPKRQMLKLLHKQSFAGGLKELVKKETYSCSDVLAICREAMDSMSTVPEDGWLMYLFRDGKHTLYPENFPDVCEPCYEEGKIFFLEVLRVCLTAEREFGGFKPTLHFSLATEGEQEDSLTREEYERFLTFCREKYLLEFMRIAAEITPFNTSGHIAGVHNVAMYMARQLAKCGLPVDLALMSGAAIAHDIGKYGCKEKESRRVPYLHYYYTDQCFRQANMPTIASIAANHSTWDLELENLSLESMLLIYADFRVKSTREDGVEVIHFYSLKDSFDVILSKLDNVDEAKKHRYEKVYAKVKDFEDYMVRLGVHTDFSREEPDHPVMKDSALIYGEEILNSYKTQTFQHNINLMNILSHEASFTDILEAARSEKDWKNTRTYINIFKEYSTYLNQKQKMATLRFLYELLMHRESDIRSAACDLMGDIIVGFDTEYRKEIPEGMMAFVQESSSMEQFRLFLKMILEPDHKLTEQHRMWVGYKMETLVASVLKKCREKKRKGYLDILQVEYQNLIRDNFTAFVMINTLERMPFTGCDQEFFETALQFVMHFAGRGDLEVDMASLMLLRKMLKENGGFFLVESYALQIMDKVPNTNLISLLYLKQQVANILNMSEEDKKAYAFTKSEERCINGAFLENLKSATPWICKLVNIEFLGNELKEHRNTQPVHTTTHLVNLLTGNECGDVRHMAGKTLNWMMDLVSMEQRNEVAIELMKGLEIGEAELSKNVPQYLGPIIVKLRPGEVEEIIQMLEAQLISAPDNVACVTLDAIAHLIGQYDFYKKQYPDDDHHEERMHRLIGLILRGMAHHHTAVSQEAVYVCGEYIFSSDALDLKEKCHIFSYMAKKLNHILSDLDEDPLSFLINAASFNDIYRFITEYSLEVGEISFEGSDKVAFFPGTFDPFSLSHKGIVNEIRKMGYQVYLAIDEFSWSKKTQPPKIRRRIASMSTADDTQVFVFPSDIPINIANNNDLARLYEIFKEQKVYIVAGSDVVVHASAYRKEIAPSSIHQFNHILFRRHGSDIRWESVEKDQSAPRILGEVIELTLPIQLEDISSTQIRENIDLNRDISHLIDSMAQNYIYENNLYLREPQYKSMLLTRSIGCQIVDVYSEKEMPDRLWKELSNTVFRGSKDASSIRRRLSRDHLTLVILRDEERDGLPVAAAIGDHIENADLLSEFGDLDLIKKIRRMAWGKGLIIKGVYGPRTAAEEEKDYLQLALTELLAYGLSKEYTFCLYHGIPEMKEEKKRVEETLLRQGFLRMTDPSSDETVMLVDMHQPILLTKNIETTIKAPLSANPRVRAVIEESHRRLQLVLTNFSRGTLVLSFDSSIMNHRLVQKIAEINEVPNTLVTPRVLGSKMCVPFGKILRDSITPNTVTKTLHTEKVFNANMHGFRIEQYPNYNSLSTQLRTIHSFDRDVILVDDLLHKGYRLREMKKLLPDSGVKIDSILLGILTANGRDLMTQYGLKSDCVYYVPNIHSWFVESSLYPFIGGDSVRSRGKATSGLLTSVNLIMPYVTPAFLANENIGAVYAMSMVCLENARNILQVLEDEYRKEFQRNLTLDRLTEVIQSPTCPDKGRFMNYDVNIPASYYIENDIEQLSRLEYFTQMELKEANYRRLHTD